MRRLLAFMMVVFLAAFTVAGCGGGEEKPPEGNGAKKEVIKIGHAVALTGDASIWGQSESKALELWAEKMNAAGGIDGKELEIVTYDTDKRHVPQADVAEIVRVYPRGLYKASRNVSPHERDHGE